jgi:hypothetical protein
MAQETPNSRYFHISKVIAKTWHHPGGGFYVWARDMPLLNWEQSHGRRQERWVKAMQEAGWDQTADSVAAIFPASQEAGRRALKKPRAGKATADSRAAEPSQPAAAPAGRVPAPSGPAGRVAEPSEPAGAAHHSHSPAFQSSEQAVRVDALFFMLLETSQHSKKTDLQSHATQMLTSLLQVCTGDVDIASKNATVVVPLSQGIADIQVLHRLAEHWPCPDRHLAKLSRSFRAEQQTDALHFLTIAVASKFTESVCTSLGQLLGQHLQNLWGSLPSDPLEAKVMPFRGPKANGRLDPDIRAAVAMAVRGGRAAVELLDRTYGGSLLRVKKPPSASRLEEGRLAELLQKSKNYSSQIIGPPQVSLAVDASRVSGEKTLVGFLVWLRCGTCCWPACQRVRDCAIKLEHNTAVADEGVASRWSYGLRQFFAPFRNRFSDPEWSDAEEEQPLQRPKSLPQRLSSHDLMVYIENILRSAGLDWSNFLHSS